MKYRTRDDDVLDRICWRHYGREDALVRVLDANPGLADRGPVLPAGLVIELPELPDAGADADAPVRLWD